HHYQSERAKTPTHSVLLPSEGIHLLAKRMPSFYIWPPDHEIIQELAKPLGTYERGALLSPRAGFPFKLKGHVLYFHTQLKLSNRGINICPDLQLFKVCGHFLGFESGILNE
ncbi:MAG: hypothetical protein Q3962_07035, partial [Corynebacterium sp.]|nr:hypothetical protein [Corynebacterium sp.]